MVNSLKVSGVYFAGPLFIVANEKKNGKNKNIMFLTFAVIGSVYLESTSYMTVESCISALRRIIAHKGVPDIIYFDNAKTFRQKLLPQELRRCVLYTKSIVIK